MFSKFRRLENTGKLGGRSGEKTVTRTKVPIEGSQMFKAKLEREETTAASSK
jgi:hypothetical protein